MKKITAFFMALLPFLVVVMLFTAGLITPAKGRPPVKTIEMINESVEVKNPTEGDLTSEEFVKNVNIFPANAQDKTIYFESANPNLVAVDKETLKLTCKAGQYGDTKIYAEAKSNPQAKATMNVKVWDDKIHRIEVINEKEAQLISPNKTLQLKVETVPNERIKNPGLNYELKAGSCEGVEVSKTGLISANANANGTATIIITPVDSAAPTSAKKEITVTVQADNSVDKIGFKDEGVTVINGSSYNLFNEIVTAPYDMSKHPGVIKPEHFKFTSSNDEMATIDNNGVITFGAKYIPGVYVDFTAKFLGSDDIAATKRIASSCNFYSDVAFEQYSYIENITAQNQELDIKFNTYPLIGDTSKILVESTDKDVVNYENGKFIAHKSGRVTLTVKVPTSSESFITDKCDVVVTDANTKILNKSTESIGKTFVYPLRKSLTKLFETQNVTWSADASEVATLDSTNEMVYFKKPGSFNVKVTCSNITETLTVTAQQPDIKKIDITDWTTKSESVNAGDIFYFAKGETPVKPQLTDAQKAIFEEYDAAKFQYIAKQGTTGETIKFDESTTFDVIVLQEAVGIKNKTNFDWVNYTTNKKEINVGTSLVSYPSTAVELDYLSRPIKITPSYEYIPEDETAVDIENDVLKFKKPTIVRINVSAGEVERAYSIKSLCGHTGKFDMKQGADVKQSGMSLKLAPYESATLTINNFAAEVDRTDMEAIKSQYSISTLSGRDIVDYADIVIDGNTLKFVFTGMCAGSDIIRISNGAYQFIINVEVSNKASNINLYCQNKLVVQENVYNVFFATGENVEGLVLDVDVSPTAAVKSKVKIKFNNESEEELTSKLIDLTKKTWKTGENTLVVSCDDITKTYKFNYNPTATPESIYAVESLIAGNVYLAAGSEYVQLTIHSPNSLLSNSYIKNNLTVTLATGETYGANEITAGIMFFPITKATSAVPGYENTATVKLGTATVSYQISRDIVSKVVLPKHNNLDDYKHAGLQRVKVYGNKTWLAGATAATDIYSVPIELYDFNGIKITDKALIEKAVDTLYISMDKGNAVYNKESGLIDVKFDNKNLYTWQEMFDNKFVDGNKSQLLEVYTRYGYVTGDTNAYTYYNFVVVDATNVYDQNGLSKNRGHAKNVVLQTNFLYDTTGVKESTKFDIADDFSFNEFYGNGYTINFEATTRLKIVRKHIWIEHLFNTKVEGCGNEYFKDNVNDLYLSLVTGGDRSEENKQTYAYSQFSCFHQVFTDWCSPGKQQWVHFKNDYFFNIYENCRVGLSISDKGNNTIVEDCAFLNTGKAAILAHNEANIYFKGHIYAYNFHGSDVLEMIGATPTQAKEIWNTIIYPLLKNLNVLQGEEYGSFGTTRGNFGIVVADTNGSPTSKILFYDHTDASGKDVYIESTHGSEKAFNYIKRTVDLDLSLFGVHVGLWATVNPSLPLIDVRYRSPAYCDEWIENEQGAEILNPITQKVLIELLSRHY